MKVKLPDGSLLEVKDKARVIDVSRTIGEGLYRATIAAKVNSKFADLNDYINDGDSIEIITSKSPEALGIMRHSCAHVLAEAVLSLYPDAKIGFGPQTDDGFFYDFDLNESISSDDFKTIEDKMQEIISKDEPFVKRIVSKSEAKEIFANQDLKLEHIDDIQDNEDLIIREHGKFTDLCSGAHVPSSKYIGAFKLLKIAGAYWKGDANNKQLTRIYGTAFFNKKDLDNYLNMLEEAKKRDHRKLGRQLGIYTMDNTAGVGLPMYLPKGAIIIRRLQEWLRKDLIKRGYEEVITPHIYNADVWKMSGHYDYYHENMYFFNINEGTSDDPRYSEYGVKPMNCPGHVLLYKNDQHSYRDLPIRYFEFGTVYRHEMSGVVHGLLRARGFTQDDAHVFCTKDQLIDEVVDILKLVDHIMGEFGFEYEAEISTRPEKSIGTDDMWEHATTVLMQACKRHNLKYEINEGDGAFYGPKIDIKVKDALSRLWQCSTVQVDFNLPERFDMNYKAKDNTEERPWMLHRAIFGSIERFLGILIEHYAGALPLWLSPVQVAILPIADRHVQAAKSLKEKIAEHGGRAEIYSQNEPMKVKIAKSQQNKIPYCIVLGDREVESNDLSVRQLGAGDLGSMQTSEFLKIIDDATRH